MPIIPGGRAGCQADRAHRIEGLKDLGRKPETTTSRTASAGRFMEGPPFVSSMNSISSASKWVVIPRLLSIESDWNPLLPGP